MQEEQKQRPWLQALPRLFLLALALAVLTMALPAQAASKAGAAREAESEKASGGTRKVIPMGRAVGIKLFSDGVMVVGLADVDTTAPLARRPATAATATPQRTSTAAAPITSFLRFSLAVKINTAQRSLLLPCRANSYVFPGADMIK